MARRVTARRKAARDSKVARWSQRVTEESTALDLEPGIFARDDAKAIARSLKRSALASDRRKADPFRSAMSMLTFYINRAGKGLSDQRRKALEEAKDELRRVFRKPVEHGKGAVSR